MTNLNYFPAETAAARLDVEPTLDSADSRRDGEKDIVVDNDWIDIGGEG